MARKVDRFKVDVAEVLHGAKKIEVKRGLWQEDRTVRKSVINAQEITSDGGVLTREASSAGGECLSFSEVAGKFGQRARISMMRIHL